MLRRAQERAQAAGLTNIQFLQAGVGDGKLEVGLADRASEFVRNLSYGEQKLLTIARVLATGALVRWADFTMRRKRELSLSMIHVL